MIIPNTVLTDINGELDLKLLFRRYIEWSNSSGDI